MNSLEKEFVPYQESLELKELGFDEPCFDYHKNGQLSDVLELVKNSEMENVNNELDDYISAPTFSQAFRWFREQYNINGLQFINQTLNGFYVLSSMEEHGQIYGYFDTYEEAELACLRKLIEIVKAK